MDPVALLGGDGGRRDPLGRERRKRGGQLAELLRAEAFQAVRMERREVVVQGVDEGIEGRLDLELRGTAA